MHSTSRRRLLVSTGLALAGGAIATSAGVGSAAAQSAEPPAQRWSRTYGQGQRNSASALVETGDGTLVVAGYTQSERATGPWLFGVDRQSGRGKWQRTLPDDNLPERGQPLPVDAGVNGDTVAVLGNSLAGGQFELLAVTTDGAVAWRQRYAAESDDTSVVGSGVDPDGEGYILGSYRVSRGESTDVTAVVRRVDGEGVTQWRHSFYPDQLSLFVTVQALGDGEYLGLLRHQEPPTGDQQPPVRSSLVKFDAGGTTEWKREYAAGGDGDAIAASQLTDFVPTERGYLLAGQATTATEDSETRGWIVATDAEGAIQAETTTGPSSFSAVGAIGGRDGRYYVAGQAAESATSGTSQGWLARLDTDATVVWSGTKGVNATSQFGDVLAADDGGVAVAGVTARRPESSDTPTSPVSKAWLAKLGGEEAPADGTDASTFPSTTDQTATPGSTPASGATPTPDPATTLSTTTTRLSPVSDPSSGPESGGETTSGSGPGLTVGSVLAGAGGLWLYRRGLPGLFGDDR